MKKRMLSLVLVLMLTISMIPTSVISTSAATISKEAVSSYPLIIDQTNNRDFYYEDFYDYVLNEVTLVAKVYEYPADEITVYWAITRSPEGMPKNAFKSYAFNKGMEFNFSELFSDSYDLSESVPGFYGVQAYLYHNGSRIYTSTIYPVYLHRVAGFVDITDESGNVISEKTIEGPYVGNTMKLNCVPGDGADLPEIYETKWEVESLVGTDVATISNDGVLTANKPGQIKVTVYAIDTQSYIANNSQTVIINIPITEFEVNLDTPVVGGDPNKIATIPEDAPYELIYDKGSWVTGVSGNTGLFAGNLIPELDVAFAPKEGYVFPARQTYLDEYSDESWYTYADDCNITVNGTKYNFTDFEDTYVDGYSENKVYGTFFEPQEFSFYWKWDRLRDPNHTYLNKVDLTAPFPNAGDGRDLAPDDQYASLRPECSNSEAIYAWSNNGDIYKVYGDYLDDNDISNDNAVQMGETETYEKHQMYRATIYLSTTNNSNTTTYFADKVAVNVNGQSCFVNPLTGSDLDGQTNAIAYYYFYPIAEPKIVEELYIDSIFAPVGYQYPASAEDITGLSSNIELNKEIYVSNAKWFVDFNNNNIMDNGEDSADFFHPDGRFIAGLRYSVYLEFATRDRDGNGVGDLIDFANNTNIYINNIEYYAQMIGNQNGAVYKFPVATTPAYAVMPDVTQLDYVFETEEYETVQNIVTFTSVGSTMINSFRAYAKDPELLDVQADGMNVYIMPNGCIPKGTYNTVVYICDEFDNTFYELPVTISVAQEEVPFILVGDINLDNEVNVNDVTYLQKYLADYKLDDGSVMIDTTDEFMFDVADVNDDGDINVKDVTLIQMLIAGLITLG
ncbi:MAG: dockerin type I repeat-containing protein [Ruminococcus sp.]|nr:dockerin type I repeat-containing protein [Ruminococcus sp.]